MESLSETKWDVLISGTGLQNSLLALALSRSDKKVLHVDQNDYYGDGEAAFSLQEVDEWVNKAQGDSPTTSFRSASLWRSSDDDSAKLSFSRAYTLTLSPQIIYTKSKLVAQLVSSKVYRQLEFQAVGNWWMYDSDILRRLPNGREDIFQDKNIDNRSKRGLMKFLKFVIDFENQADVWEAHADDGLGLFLSSKFQLPPSLQSVITALTLSLQLPEKTPVKWALPRLARHLTSIGVFGPGFGAVVPKWGGGAEIAQVACRAGAVGGGIYILGTGVQNHVDGTDGGNSLVTVTLTNGEIITTKRMIASSLEPDERSFVVSRIIVIVSSPLTSLFQSTVEGAPLSAVSVVAFPPCSISVPDAVQAHPIYIMAHSSETGECPAGQCVLYATTLSTGSSKILLEGAISAFLQTAENGEGKPLYKWYYEQKAETPDHATLDLAFDDAILDEVEKQWKSIVQPTEEIGAAKFMLFEERNAMDDEEDNHTGD